MVLSADGEAGKAWGNETIRVARHNKDGWSVTIRLPAPLAHLSNTPLSAFRTDTLESPRW